MGIGGALAVLAFAVALGWGYHLAHRWLWDEVHVWVPFVPGLALGYLVGASVQVWRKARRRPVGPLAPTLALLASLLLIGVRFHLDGLAYAGRARPDSERARVTAYLDRQAGRSFAFLGSGRIRGEPFWWILGAELGAIVVIALIEARSGSDPPTQ